MNKLLLIFLITITGIINAQKTISYELYSTKDTIVLGEFTKLNLVINGFDELINKDERLQSFESREKFSFQVGPTTLGKHEFGPYKIKINNKKLVSNKITIVVIERSQYTNNLTYTIPDSIYQDSIVELQLLNDKEYLNLEIKDHENYKLVSKSSSSSMSINKGIVLQEYTQTFKLKFIKPGVFKITKEMFEESIDDFQIKEKKVFVIETKITTN